MFYWFFLYCFQLLAVQDFILYDSEFYLRVAGERGYVAQSKERFVISNGLRNGFKFERVPNQKGQVFIKNLSTGDYVSANPYPKVTAGKKPSYYEVFTVYFTKNRGYQFKSIDEAYLMANLEKFTVELSRNAGLWETFFLERVYDKQGLDRRGFHKNGTHYATQGLEDPRGFNQRGFDKVGLTDFKSASAQRSHNEYLKRQQDYLTFIEQGQRLQSTSNPNIYIVILDTMRADFVNHKTGPNLLAFRNSSVHSEIALSGATTTHPSIYSLFSARPSYEFYPMISSGYTMGSMPLNILKYKLGYEIKATGKRDMGCLAHRPYFSYYPMSWNSYLVAREFRFGLQSHLLESCKIDGFLGNEAFYDEGLKALDENIFKHLESLIESSKRQKTVFLAHLEGAHAPYIYSKEDQFLETEFRWESERNYSAAFHRTDRLFGQFIRNLKNKGLYDDALIIVLGDHGEVLPGPPLTEGDHGSYPIDKAQTRIPLYFKFPKADSRIHQPVTKVTTLADVFPTLFDYLGVLESVEHFFTGRSIWNLKTHIIPISRVNPDNEMSFYAYPYKLNVLYRPWAYVHPASMDQLHDLLITDLELGTLENFDDQPIEVPKFIRIDSSELANFREIFPALFEEYQDSMDRK